MVLNWVEHQAGVAKHFKNLDQALCMLWVCTDLLSSYTGKSNLTALSPLLFFP